VAGLDELYGKVRGIYYETPESAVRVAGTSVLRDLSGPDGAAWTIVARAILNLDEVITRE
jgi:hypothetical protein